MKQDKFQIFPAIDLIDGKCVRLLNGDYAIKSSYKISPIEQVKIFDKLNYQSLHVIDLDGAKKGQPVNIELIKDMILNTDSYIQVGGGIRTVDAINEYLHLGVDQVIMSSAIFDGGFEWNKVDISRITASLDLKGNDICINGWLSSVEDDISEVIQRLKMLGINRVIVTDISRDGTLSGPNIDLAIRIKCLFNGEVLVAGGVCNQEDIMGIIDKGLDGAIVGKAMYGSGVLGV
jgi:phosphoribosylformimino-5-aminoimidazole carboxamide ribotide isomerase